MKTTIIIPAKGTSERVVSKNLYRLNGKSLVYRVCEKVLKCKLVDEVFIDTESDEIVENVCSLFDSGLKLIRRPQHMATNETSGNDLVNFEKQFVKNSDLFVHTYATSPLLTFKTIDECIQKFIDNWDRYDSFFTARPVKEYIWDKNGPVNFSLEGLPNSNELGGLWKETHGLYGIKMDTLNSLNRRLGNISLPIEISEKESLDIDYYSDIEYLECVYGNQQPGAK
jgi:CMP-N-acetylneuraminic acid synthetase